MYDQSKTRQGMSSHCIVPSWNERNPDRQQQFEQVPEEGATEGQKGNKFFCNSPPLNTSCLVLMPNYGVRELTWENGQLNIHGLCGLIPSTATARPAWMDGLNSCETLESVVHQAALHSQLQSLENQSPDQSGKDGSGARKRLHSDSDLCFGDGDESLGICQSVSLSANAAFNRDNDTKSMSWASYESCRSLKTARTADKVHAFAGSETQETEGEEHETKREAGRSGSRRGRAAAVHNESERRRRGRINQRMKTLQKLVPNASKTDKVSILDDVIEYMKQLQAQVQMMMDMRANFNLQQQMMMSPQPQFMQQQQQQRQFQMSLLAAMAQMGMASGGALGGFFPPTPLMVPSMPTQPPQANNKDNNFSSSVALSDPYSTFLAQTMNMDLYNKMAAAIYKQQSKQTTQVTSNTPSHSLNHGQGD